MSNIHHLLLKNHKRFLHVTLQRNARCPFTAKKPRPFEERNKMILEAHRQKKLVLADRTEKPDQFQVKEMKPDPVLIKKELKLPNLSETKPFYQKYSDEDIKEIQTSTWYDPLFNPHLHEQRNKINPNEEPFDAIYVDSKSELANEYTKVRNITTPQLWEYVERLARIKIPPMPDRRKPGEPINKTPSGFVPPPEECPDLPYFIPRTRNYLLPVYYNLNSDPEKCYTIVKQIVGDLWKLEEDLRTYLEAISKTKKRILTSVQETDGRILLRGRHLHQVVSWLHEKGF